MFWTLKDLMPPVRKTKHGIVPRIRPTANPSFPSTGSVAAEDNEAALAELFGELNLHNLRGPVGHRIQVLVQLRYEPHAVLLDDAGRLDPVLVVLEALFGREPGHADVVPRLAVPLGIPQVNDIDVVVLFIERYGCSLESRSVRDVLLVKQCNAAPDHLSYQSSLSIKAKPSRV